MTDTRTDDAVGFAEEASMTDDDREALREEIDQAIRPAVDQVLADARRPYKRALFWLSVAYVVLFVLSVVEWVTR